LILYSSLFPKIDGKNCKTCDRISSILETKTTELDENGIKVVKLNDKKTAKQYGILSVPGLTFFKGGKGSNYEGNVGVFLQKILFCVNFSNPIHNLRKKRMSF